MSEQQNPLGAVVAKALQDEAFKQELIADPAATLAAAGVALPAGVTLKVVEDTAQVRHLVLPAAGGGRLSESELAGVAGGGDDGCGSVMWQFENCGCSYDEEVWPTR